MALPPETTLDPPSEGALLMPDGSLVAHRVGDFGLRTPSGRRTVHANLLDERESDTAGNRRDLDWDPGSPTGREPKRRGYGGIAAGAALVLLLLAWLLQLRTE
jgi:hypothetical protein